MNEILQEDNYNEVSMNSEDSKCREIKELQNKFSDLIADYKFSQNEFMKQESDVIALIDLAQACVLFSGQNYKAVGVCYNNIANLHYKNEKYQLAADSYLKAWYMAYVCLGEMTPNEFYKKFKSEKPDKIDALVDDPKKAELQTHFKTVKAHRFYQFAMCMYKVWRYADGGDLLEKSNSVKQKNLMQQES